MMCHSCMALQNLELSEYALYSNPRKKKGATGGGTAGGAATRMPARV